MVIALDSRASSLVPDLAGGGGGGHCVVFLCKTGYSHSASLHPGYKWVPPNLMLGGNPAMDWHPIQAGVDILSVTSCYRNRDKLLPDGSLGPNADFTYRKLVESRLLATRIYPFIVLSGERHREQEYSTGTPVRARIQTLHPESSNHTS